MTIAEKMKNAGSKEKAMEELGKYLEDRLSELGKKYGDLTGAFIGTFISITNRLLTGEFDEKRYEEWKENAKSSYRDIVLKDMEELIEDIDKIAREMHDAYPYLKNLKKSSEPPYVR